MKQKIINALIIFSVLTLNSCTKEEIESSEQINPNSTSRLTSNYSDDQEISEIIERADAELWNRIYNEQYPGKDIEIEIQEGIYQECGDGSATCMNETGYCVITVIDRPDLNGESYYDDNQFIILNEEDNPISKAVSYVRKEKDPISGITNIYYEEI